MTEGRARRTVSGQARFGSKLSFVVTLLAALLFAETALAQHDSNGLVTAPVLRIETGIHGAAIWRIATDARNRFAATASDDKTVRIWSLPDGKLKRIIWLPIGPGGTGKAYAVAMSPDGNAIAVGGFTGLEGSEQYIFLFDRQSGKLEKLIQVPDSVLHLAYSSDGALLAASLPSGGIRVFDVRSNHRLLPSDTQYSDRCNWLSFDASGRLVTASYDGYVRLYASGHYDRPVARYHAAGKPFSAEFSPNGRRVAVGFVDIPKIVVLSGSDLVPLFEPNVADVHGDLPAVGWLPDGQELFAGGSWTVGNVRQVRRWEGGGKGAFADIPVSADRVMDLVPLRPDTMLFAGRSGFGLIRRNSQVVHLQNSGVLDLRSGGNKELRIEGDGGIVQVNAWDPLHSYRFTVAKRQEDIDPPIDSALAVPVTKASGLDIANWFNAQNPSLNGSPIKLKPRETSESLAIAPDGHHFVVGTNWRVRTYDRSGKELWDQISPGVAWRVNISRDGRLVVAAFEDGTIRWWRLEDGRELLALFMHPDGKRWVLWTPQGYYDASIGGDDLIGWQINHGYSRAPDYYPVSQFRERFYRPDVIKRVLQTLDVDKAVALANEAAGHSVAKAAPVASLLTPVVEINDPTDPAAFDRTDVELTYSVRLPAPNDTLRIEALIDGVQVAARNRPTVDVGSLRVGNLHLSVPRRDSRVSVIAYNANGASEPASIHVQWRGPGTDPKLTLYVVAIGVAKYKNPKFNLQFPAKDADDFVALAKAQEGGLYEKVITDPAITRGSLTDEHATKEAILEELDWITHAVTNTNDVAMIFLSGHGVETPDRHYRFLPYNYDADHTKFTSISDDELKDYLTGIGGKKIFFFDTCYSGGVLGGVKAASTAPDVSGYANDLRMAKNGIIVFTSSDSSEFSQENPKWNNGAFTKAVVEGMRGQAARPGVPIIMISDLNGYIARRVKELTNGEQKPNIAMPQTVEDFPIAERVP